MLLRIIQAWRFEKGWAQVCGIDWVEGPFPPLKLPSLEGLELLFHPVGDTASGEIVGGEFDFNLVAGKNPDEVLANFS